MMVVNHHILVDSIHLAFGVGPWEIILILLVALVVLGPKRLPEIAKSLGKGLREFRKTSQELQDSIITDVARPNQPEKDVRKESPDQATQKGSDDQIQTESEGGESSQKVDMVSENGPSEEIAEVQDTRKAQHLDKKDID